MSDLGSLPTAAKIGKNSRWYLVTDEAQLTDLRADWERLFASNPLHSPFLAWGWVKAWLTYRAGPHCLRVLVHRDGSGRAQFILPMIQRTSASLLRKNRLTMVCSYGSEASDYLGCLRLPGIDEQMADMATDGLEQLFGENYSLELSFSDNASEFPSRLESISRAKGRATRLMTDAVCPAIELPSSWDEYLQRLSSNFRSQIRRHYRKVTATDGLCFRSVDCCDAQSFIDSLIRLNRQRIKDKGEVSSLENESVRTFLSASVVYMAKQGLAWMDVLEQDGETVGSSLHFVHGTTVYYYMGGFREDAKHLRPGTALFAHVIQRSIEQGFEVFDFLRGDDAYKYRWGATDRKTSKLDVYPGRPIVGKLQWAVDECELKLRGVVRSIRGTDSKGAAF